MKHRTKIFITVFLTVVLINLVTLAILYLGANRFLFQEVGNNALSIAATTAAFVDGEQHKTIQKPVDEDKDEYGRIKDVLMKAREANRRNDTWVKNLYTMKPKTEDLAILAYGVDTEEDPNEFSAPDQPVKVLAGRNPVLAQLGVDSAEFSGDQHGQWLSANAPIRDRAGQVVAAVGVDLPASFVQTKLNRVRRVFLYSLGIAVVLGAVAGFGLSARSAKPVRSLYEAVKALERGDLEVKTDVSRRDEFGLMAGAVKSLCKCMQQRAALISALTPLISSEELEWILEHGTPPEVQTKRRHITVLFSDIREFTQMSENMSPEDVAKLLNEYFGKMVDVVLRHHGIIDKFIGDGLMALFGAAHEDAFQEQHAVRAALEMQQELSELSEKWSREGRPPMRIGVGINSGTAIVGNLGSAQRLEYTAIGDTVNLASRLESATKDLQADILISEHTHASLRGEPFTFTNKGAISVKGRAAPVTVYAVTPVASARAPEPSS